MTAPSEASEEARLALFGRRAVEMGFATPAQVLEALRVQERARTVLGRFLLLGEVLWLRGVIDETQLDRLVGRGDAARSGEHCFGEFALQLGLCSAERLFEGLAEQRADRDAGRPNRLLGEILVEKGYLTPEDVDLVVANLIVHRDPAADL